MATLEYTKEKRSFVYGDGDYKIWGNKVIEDGKFIRIEGGDIKKGGVFIASFSFSVNDGEIKNLLVNFAGLSDFTEIIKIIKACFGELTVDSE